MVCLPVGRACRVKEPSAEVMVFCPPAETMTPSRGVTPSWAGEGALDATRSNLKRLAGPVIDTIADDGGLGGEIETAVDIEAVDVGFRR